MKINQYAKLMSAFCLVVSISGPAFSLNSKPISFDPKIELQPNGQFTLPSLDNKALLARDEKSIAADETPL